MSKLYLFAIGGTGIRVLNSFVNLVSTGIYTNVEEVVPMVIDTDINNGDLEKLRKIIRNYREINESLYSTSASSEFKDHFFRTRIANPKELNISGLDYGTLGDMLSYNSLVAGGYKSTRFLVDLLFNEHNLAMKLENGFLGNPNVGSIVLKNVIDTKGFKKFMQEFNNGDRIFIINSIFGGTGAAGFPLLLKVFRDNTSELSGKYINDSIIGGVTVLPYFEVDVEKFHNGESSINSNTFISKTKAALSYYDKHIGNLINALYFIGDTERSQYENIEGGNLQKNPNNFIEFASALAIVDFLNYEKKSQTREDLSKDVRYFEFGIDSNEKVLNLTHLKGLEEVIKPLILFTYFAIYLTNYLQTSLDNKKLVFKKVLNIPNNFHESSFINSLKNFCGKHYYYWLYNLNHDSHSRKFYPFNLSFKNPEIIKQGINKELELSVNDDMLFNIVKNIPAMKKDSLLKKDKIIFDDTFTTQVDEISKMKLHSIEQKFMALMYKGILKIYNERFVN